MKLPILRRRGASTLAAPTRIRNAILLPMFGPVDISLPLSVIVLASKASAWRDCMYPAISPSMSRCASSDASAIPKFIPRPPTGEWAWAASPARWTFPFEQVSAMRTEIVNDPSRLTLVMSIGKGSASRAFSRLATTRYRSFPIGTTTATVPGPACTTVRHPG